MPRLLDNDHDDDHEPVVPRPDAAAIFAQYAIEATLTRKHRAMLARSASIVIVSVPHADWVDTIEQALKRMFKNSAIMTATECARSSGNRQPVGADHLRLVQKGHKVIFVSQDPEGVLDQLVRTAADCTIAIKPPTPTLLRRIIRTVGAGVARGVTAQMAGLAMPIVLSAVRPGLTPGQCVANLRRALEQVPAAPLPSVPMLSELPLTTAMRSWTDETLRDLAAVRVGTLSPDMLTYGVLEGAPGTGKSLIAQSLARSADWAFVQSSVGGWFTSGDGALGGVVRNLKAFTDALLEHEPAIGFLDEIEALPDRASLDPRAREWWTPVVTYFLLEVDRLRQSGRNILLLAGTNFPDRLDRALVRPGRLQQRITVLAPQTVEEVVAVLRYYLGDSLIDADLAHLGQIGRGATPATIESWVKAARSAARIKDLPLAIGDLLDQIVPIDHRSPQDIRTIALHEAGHAVVAHRLGHTVDRVTIIAQGNSGGHTHSALPTQVPTLDDLHDIATVMLAGRAADILIGAGANTGSEADIADATQLLLAARERQGLGGRLLYAPALGGQPSSTTADAVAAKLDSLLARALDILKAERAQALRLADCLMAARILSGEEVAEILEVGRGALAERSDGPPSM